MKNKLLLTSLLICISFNLFPQQQGIVTREQVLNMYYKAQQAEKNNKKDEAIKIYNELLSIDQSLSTPYLKLANIYAADENNIASVKLAVPLYEKYLELNPEYKDADAVNKTIGRLKEKLKNESAVVNSPAPKTQEVTVNPAPEVSEDTDINTLWDKAQTAIKDNNYGIAENMLTRIISFVSPNHPLFAQSNILLANIYGKTGNTGKMQDAIAALESYIEIHEQVTDEIGNMTAPVTPVKVVNKIPFEDDLCGIWISDYSEDKDRLPYLALEVVNTGSKYIARILPHCTLAKKHNMYTGLPFQYSLSNLSGQASTTAYSATNSADAVKGKFYLALTENLEIYGDKNVANLFFGDEATKENKKGFAESAVHTVGTLVDNPVIDIAVAGLSLFFSELTTAKNTIITLNMNIKQLFRGCAELILEQNSYIDRLNGKAPDRQQSSKIMKLYKLYPEYDVKFASEGNELFGYKEFKKSELFDIEEYKQLLKTNSRKDFNKQSYKKLAGKVIETAKSSLPEQNSDLIREINENFEYATQGFSYQEIVNDNGIYKGWTDISGKSNGYGHAVLKSGYEYLGEWKDSKYYGTGKYTIPGTGVYTGGFLNGKFHGKGIFTYLSGEEYEGEWKNGEAQTGKIKYAGGDVYEGQCKYNKKEKRIEKHGKGTVTYANGETVSGNWENDTLTTKN